jgi:hypothetical protein
MAKWAALLNAATTTPESPIAAAKVPPRRIRHLNTAEQKECGVEGRHPACESVGARYPARNRITAPSIALMP